MFLSSRGIGRRDKRCPQRFELQGSRSAATFRYATFLLMAFVPHLATSIGSTISSVLDSAGKFFSQLASLSWISLLIALGLYSVYLLLRSRALYNAVRAAYPGEKVRWRDVWGAYMVGYAVSNVFPLGGGNIAQWFLTRISIPPSSYPTVASSLWTGVIFDYFMGLLVMCFAFTQGVFPKPPDFSKLPAFDISFFAGHMRFTLFFLTVIAMGFLVGFALLSAKVRAFWQRVRQGFTILRDRRRYLRQMATWQFASWVFRFASYWALLDAFHIGGSVRNALLVLGRAGRGLGIPVHARRPRRPAGPADHDLRGQSERGLVLGRPADRDGRTECGAGLCCTPVHLPLQELPRGDRTRQGASKGRGGCGPGPARVAEPAGQT